VRLQSGRELVVFVDRNAIGWGENWRDRLLEGIDAAAVLLPVVTATYLRSPVCREEFLAFQAKADAVGATGLVLPVVLVTSRTVRPDSPDAIARFVATHQHANLEAALLDGYDSPAWTTATATLAGSLIAAWERAVRTRSAIDAPPDPAALLAELGDRMAAITATADGLSGALERLAQAAHTLGQPGDGTEARHPWTSRAARALEPPARDLEELGVRLYTEVKAADLALRRLSRAAATPDDTGTALRPVLESWGGLFRGVGNVAGVTARLLSSFRDAEATSAPLRRSLQPARDGLTAVRDAIGLLKTWDFPGDAAGSPRRN
jgi:hypothetical protein